LHNTFRWKKIREPRRGLTSFRESSIGQVPFLPGVPSGAIRLSCPARRYEPKNPTVAFAGDIPIAEQLFGNHGLPTVSSGIQASHFFGHCTAFCAIPKLLTEQTNHGDKKQTKKAHTAKSTVMFQKNTTDASNEAWGLLYSSEFGLRKNDQKAWSWSLGFHQ